MLYFIGGFALARLTHLRAPSDTATAIIRQMFCLGRNNEDWERPTIGSGVLCKQCYLFAYRFDGYKPSRAD